MISKALAGAAGCVVVAVAVGAWSARAQPPAQPPAAAPAVAPNTGYCIGYDMGKEVRESMARDGVKVDADALIKGFTDAFRGTPSTVPEAEMAKVLAEVQKGVDQRASEARMKSDPVYRAAAEEAAGRSKTFLERFAARPGVKTLPGGIVYEVVKAGTGDAASGAKRIAVTYQANLTNNETAKRGENVKVLVDDLVPGAQQAVRQMKVGDRWYVAIPATLAFAERGFPPNIGPNEAIVLDVELLGVEK